MNQKLLTRDDFREGVFARDKHKCVFCGEPAQDAHHILERRLWPDGGYYLDNGASVCGKHHIMCETTELSVEDVRIACGILKPIIPPHLYDDQVYDKWGNPVMPNGTRLKGELFFDESVQKVIKPYLDLFVPYVKYQRTYHLPWSPTPQKDDRQLTLAECRANFEGKRVIATIKKDGENTTMYPDYIHARSVDSRNHVSRNWVKNYWSQICGDIPEGWRICGENLFAEHSIKYSTLDSYFYGFQLWNERNFCLDWNLTVEYFELMNVIPVEKIYDDIYDEKRLLKLHEDLDLEMEEGFVLRTADGFSYGDFRNCVAKWVRPNHVQTTKHWMHGQPVIQNGLKGK